MTEPERELLRDRERTRRAVLEAAEQAVAQKGTKVSLAEIAALAGVTKGGLLHHFRSRDALVEALVVHTIQRIWDEVLAHVDQDEGRPGAFTRGYVRALTGGSDYLARVFSPSGLLASLGAQEVAELSSPFEQDDARAWDEAFAADGLPPGRALAVRFAADGLAVAAGTPYVSDEQLALAREELLALTEVEPD